MYTKLLSYLFMRKVYTGNPDKGCFLAETFWGTKGVIQCT